MFDTSLIPTVSHKFKEYSLALTGNANFITITDKEREHHKLYGVNAALPFDVIANTVSEIFPVAAITKCRRSEYVSTSLVTKYPIIEGALLLASTYYFIFPLIHRVPTRGCYAYNQPPRYSLQAPYNRMTHNVLRTFAVCALIEFGKADFTYIPHNLTRGFYCEESNYVGNTAEYVALEVLAHECGYCGKTA